MSLLRRNHRGEKVNEMCNMMLYIGINEGQSYICYITQIKLLF